MISFFDFDFDFDFQTLNAVNVGDSGFMVVRGGKVIYQSPVQQWSFNCPYQLGSRKKDNPDLAMVCGFDPSMICLFICPQFFGIELIKVSRVFLVYRSI